MPPSLPLLAVWLAGCASTPAPQLVEERGLAYSTVDGKELLLDTSCTSAAARKLFSSYTGSPARSPTSARAREGRRSGASHYLEKIVDLQKDGPAWEFLDRSLRGDR